VMVKDQLYVLETRRAATSKQDFGCQRENRFRAR
jgi:hypothetical protein